MIILMLHQVVLINMNKSDLKLIIILLIILISAIIIIIGTSTKSDKAVVYHNNELIKTIDLKINKDYIINGDNGKIKIIVNNNRIKVASENSKNHLCSKQGYISHSYESIICLPNKVVIKIIGKSNIDTKVG